MGKGEKEGGKTEGQWNRKELEKRCKTKKDDLFYCLSVPPSDPATAFALRDLNIDACHKAELAT